MNDESNKMEEHGKDTLERTIGFINSCDTKASITLGIVGIFLSVLCSDLPMEFETIKTAGENSGCAYVFFAFFSFLSIALLLASVGLQIAVLFARVKKAKYDSMIYFVNISKCRSMEDYLKDFAKMTNKVYEQDIVNQTYINATICTRKFSLYNIGLVFLGAGMISFVVAFMIKIFCF